MPSQARPIQAGLDHASDSSSSRSLANQSNFDQAKFNHTNSDQSRFSRSASPSNPQASSQSSGERRRNLQISEALNCRLAAYALAAMAMGVGTRAAAQQPLGHIVYTPANIPILAPGGSTIALDLNKDGIADFYIRTTGYSSSNSGQFIKHEGVYETPAIGNYAIGKQALHKGEIIDVGGKFRTSKVGLAVVNFFAASGHFGSTSKGAFKHVTDKYLGVRFRIAGQMHEGWVRLTMTQSFGDISGAITGYAFDTVPNETGLAAGQIRSREESAEAPENTVQPATLGMLGLGAAGLELWRR